MQEKDYTDTNKVILGLLLILRDTDARDVIWDDEDHVEVTRQAFEFACEHKHFEEAAEVLTVGSMDLVEWRYDGYNDYACEHRFVPNVSEPICHITYDEKSGLKIVPNSDLANCYFHEQDTIGCYSTRPLPFTEDNWNKACEEGYDAFSSDIIGNLECVRYDEIWRDQCRDDHVKLLKHYYELGYEDECLSEEDEQMFDKFEELVEWHDIDYHTFGVLVYETDQFHGEGGLENPWIYPDAKDDLLKKHSPPETISDLLFHTKELVKAYEQR